VDGDTIRKEILRACNDMDIPLVGFAPVDRWDQPPFSPWVPEEFRPRSIFAETRTVIVIGIPVSLPVIDTAPSTWYRELYRTVNALLDQDGYRIASRLTAGGYPSVWIPRDGYGSIGVLKENPVAFFSHRHAAFLAGLGTFGVSNTILTPAFGPRVRFASIFTAAELPPDPVMTEQLCTRCMACVNACPVNALDGRDYPAGLTDRIACAARSFELDRRYLSPCGLCIRVCPVGDDRRVFHRQDTEMYDEADERAGPLHRSWRHIRTYGSR
jgi:epoxyqueuosine reductase QueG